jgi:L-malate glycosyltransferase
MRILHLATFLQGGAGLVISRLASAQAAAGHDVTVVTSRTGAPGYGNYPQYLAALEAGGVACHAVDSLFARDDDANDAVLRFLEQQIATHGAPAIVHAHAAVPARIGIEAMAGRGGAARVLQTMHGWGIAKSSAQASADLQVMNRVSLVVVPSRTAAAQMVALGLDDRQLRIVPYGVEPAPDAGRGEPDPDGCTLESVAAAGDARRKITCVARTRNCSSMPWPKCRRRCGRCVSSSATAPRTRCVRAR